MAKTTWQIELDYRSAIGKAKELDNIANDLQRNAYNKYQEVIEDLNVAWDGDNRIGYVNKLEEMKREVRKSIDNLRKIANSIRNIAEITRRAELDAARIARERSYGGGLGGGGW